MKHYIIFNDCRGVYFGAITDTQAAEFESGQRTTLRIDGCRHVFYAASHGGDVDGLTALAIRGPAAKSRIGPPTSRVQAGIKALIECEPAAVAAFAEASWVRG